MSRIVTVAALVAFAFASPAVLAESSPQKTQAKKVRVAKASQARQAARDKAAEPPAEVAQSLNDNQLQIASRVLVGRVDCEFNQTITVQPWAEHPGHFKLAYKNATYTMVPEETTTGAVRLEDKRAGIVWLQIPSKSMLMNSKIGQRMVDYCTHPQQRVAGTTTSG
jgi:hypothetical protein